MKNFRGFGRVFSFTFLRQVTQSGYKRLTAAVAALCLLVPIAVLGVMALRADSRSAAPDDEVMSNVIYVPLCNAKSVRVVDETAQPLSDWNFLQTLRGEEWNMTYHTAPEQDDAYTLVVHLQKTGERYTAQVNLPQGVDSALTQGDIFAYEEFLRMSFPVILQAKAGLSADQLSVLTAPITVAERTDQSADPADGVREILGMILPYVGVMLIYFLVLFYGQGVANSVILEKTSKLMDFFLVSVEPVAMVLGKVLAIALSGLLQLCIWLISLLGGFAGGIWLYKTIAPQQELGLITFFRSLRLFDGMFSLPAVLLAVGIILGGFLIYCALSGVGGALAGKAEDLSSTNVLFSMALVVSFLCCLLGGSGEGIISQARWLDFVPFTAIMVTPARVLLGEVNLGMGALTLVIVLVTAVLLCVLAGKVYRMMSLYKGDPPSVQKLFVMLKEHK